MPYWSSVYTNKAFPYVPQLKDVVIYFPKPHLDFLRKNGRKLKEKIDFDVILPTDKALFEGIVDEIEYIPAEIVKCRITLKIMIGKKYERIQFNYFFGINQPSYIVLKSTYISNREIKFKVNETVKIRNLPCQDENGIILDVNEDTDPLKSFGNYKILW